MFLVNKGFKIGYELELNFRSSNSLIEYLQGSQGDTGQSSDHETQTIIGRRGVRSKC